STNAVSPCRQDSRNGAVHAFQPFRFHGLLWSSLGFPTKSAGVLKVHCSLPFPSVRGISHAPKRRTLDFPAAPVVSKRRSHGVLVGLETGHAPAHLGDLTGLCCLLPGGAILVTTRAQEVAQALNHLLRGTEFRVSNQQPRPEGWFRVGQAPHATEQQPRRLF